MTDLVQKEKNYQMSGLFTTMFQPFLLNHFITSITRFSRQRFFGAPIILSALGANRAPKIHRWRLSLCCNQLS